MKIHLRADTPLEMIEESFIEILFTIRSCLCYSKDNNEDNLFWQRVNPENTNGVLGFPACILMLSLVDALGSFFEENDDLKIQFTGEQEFVRISLNKNKTHFYIFNSFLFDQNLSREKIDRLWDLRNSLLHNNVLTNNIRLVNSDKEPFMDKVKGQSGEGIFFELRLLSFYKICEEAVRNFLVSTDLVDDHLNSVMTKLKNRESFFNKSVSNQRDLDPSSDLDIFPST
ncbi:hypothetical protein [Membranihabitans maritimus]|uniref:hypothetical protein n=1 Tax=Membranihabitans maritimus TaxID=2904244 RepID=UPI001F2A7EA1|nr:hypothetical protein [Membranihabitans maritimus]